MIVTRRDANVIVVEESSETKRHQLLFALLAMLMAGSTHIGPHAGNTASIIAACGFAIFGLIALLRPSSCVEIDRLRREIRIMREFPAGLRRTRTLGFEEVADLYIERSSDNDGPAHYRPSVRLRSGKSMYVTSSGVPDKHSADVVADAMRAAIFGSAK
jgi:hypothetical protein